MNMPNFYLFSSLRGLFLHSETLLNLGKSGLLLGIGTGLDSFGLRKTGPVDRFRIGGQVYSLKLFSGVSLLTLSPYIYLDFTRDLKHLGQSIGAEIKVFRVGRLSLYAKIEHNRNDMIEQVIKYKEDGVYFISGLIINL